jgi:L-seryl-tRNA(Ser) seleniumtransferase
MIATPEAELRWRAEQLAVATGAEAIAVRSTVGGGSLPGETLPSWGVALGGRSPDRLLARLRTGEAAIVGRIEDGRVVLDLRTVDPEADGALADAIRASR